MFSRTLSEKITSKYLQGKIIMILGPRQVGKTTLVETLLKDIPSIDKIFFTGDDSYDRAILSSESFSQIDRIIGKTNYIVIDEWQKIPHIGNTLKILVDRYKDTKQIFVIGSSSVHLLDTTNEPLTGRKFVFTLFSISVWEYIDRYGIRDTQKELETHLLYGMYPEVLELPSRDEKITRLTELSESGLYRDILEFQEVRNSGSIHKLLELLALQIGSEVSYNELAIQLGMSTNTVERYIDLLEKSYVIFRLSPYFTNKRKEISKMKKIYFYDLGIRNAIIRSFNPLRLRTDLGGLFENFCLIERMKHRHYSGSLAYPHFWRGSQQEEIDLIELTWEDIQAFEIKYKPQKIHIPKKFSDLYPKASYELVSSENYLDFLMIQKTLRSETILWREDIEDVEVSI